MDSSRSQHHDGKRKPSRSPYRGERSTHDVKRSRSRSPRRNKSHRHRERSLKAQRLPFKSSHLHKSDLEAYRPLLAEYLDVQKRLDIAAIGEDEVKGRWKSFLRKWNAGELAEGWYDPGLKARADGRVGEMGAGSDALDGRKIVQNGAHDQESDSEDGYGPALPHTAQRTGPAVPNLQDLQYRREMQDDDRDERRAALRSERKADRKLQKERLEEIAPRADPGSRERQLEKKRDVTATNNAFADAKEGGADEVGEQDLMGDDGGDAFKRQLKEKERQKNEREIRKEEVLRARAAEREERMAKARAKEDKTMEMLRGIAQARFGGGGGGG